VRVTGQARATLPVLTPGSSMTEFTDLCAYPDLLRCTGQLLSFSEDTLATLRAERSRCLAERGRSAPLMLREVDAQISRCEAMVHDAKHALARAYGHGV
jgi:hypothetical protein